MLKKLFQQLIRFFARLFSSHRKPFEFPKGSKKPPIRPIIFVPGSSASIQRFNGTIRMLHRFSRKKQSLLKIKVNKDDS
ncbi:MAG: alpha/beta hydrolase, partial [Streptococcus sp.]|nr:alpha/beta hydrolase [Streptococcus sp.]